MFITIFFLNGRFNETFKDVSNTTYFWRCTEQIVPNTTTCIVKRIGTRVVALSTGLTPREVLRPYVIIFDRFPLAFVFQLLDVLIFVENI